MKYLQPIIEDQDKPIVTMEFIGSNLYIDGVRLALHEWHKDHSLSTAVTLEYINIICEDYKV